MSVLVDLKVTELLCSKLCHDLISPIGAVNSGLEVLEEGDAALEREAMGLIARSGAMAAKRLSFYRLAFGFAGSAEGVHSLSEIRGLAEGYLAGGSVGLDWPGGEGAVSRGGARLLLNLVLIGADCLPRGGVLSVRFGSLPEGLGVALTAAGTGARLREDLGAALADGLPLADLTARNIQALFTRRLAEELGVGVEVAEGSEGDVRLAAVLPA